MTKIKIKIMKDWINKKDRTTKINEDGLKVEIKKKDKTIKKNKNVLKVWIINETREDNRLMKMFWKLILARKRG